MDIHYSELCININGYFDYTIDILSDDMKKLDSYVIKNYQGMR